MMDEIDRQKRFLIKAGYIFTCFAIFYLIVRYAMYALMPFTIAVIVTSLLKRPVDRASKALHIKRKAVAIIFVLLFYLMLALIAVYGVNQAMMAVANWFGSLDTLFSETIEPMLNDMFANYEQLMANISPAIEAQAKLFTDQLTASAEGLVNAISAKCVDFFHSALMKTPAMFIATIFCVVSTVFISIDYYDITYFILAQFNVRQQKIITDGKEYLIGSIGGIIKSYGLIMIITMCELFVGLRLIGISNAGTLAIIIGVFDILPALGTGGIMVPWGLFVLLSGNVRTGAALLFLYAFITVVRNILEPKIVGETTGLHPVLLLISIYIGGAIFGPLGVLIMPFSLIVLKKLNDSGMIQLFRSDYFANRSPEYRDKYGTGMPIQRDEER